MSNKKLFIEVGHGGDDHGGRSICGISEKAMNLYVGLRLKDRLSSCNIQVLLSRDDDTYYRPSDIALKCNEFNADLGIAIHHNAFDGSRQGWEIVKSVHAPNAGFSELLGNLYSRVLLPCRGVYTYPSTKFPNRDYLTSMDNTICSYVFSEYMYMDNPNKLIGTPELNNECDLLFEAICQWFNLINTTALKKGLQMLGSSAPEYWITPRDSYDVNNVKRLLKLIENSGNTF